MVGLIIALSIVGLLLIIIFICSIKIVRQTQKIIVERMGGYHKTWDVGIHMLVPFIDRVAYRISMKEQIKDFAPQDVITKDNVTMKIDTVAHQAPLSMEFSMQEYWSGLLFPSPGDLPNPGIEPRSPAGRFLLCGKRLSLPK